MSREKQIEEIARTFCGGCDRCLHGNCTDWYKAEAVYEADYRKQREVVMEIFAELETVLYSVVIPNIEIFGQIETKKLDGLHIRIEDYNAIKKKYTEG